MGGIRATKAKGPWVGADAVGAPTDAQYVVMALNGTLTQERVLTAGAGITIVDGGANAAVTLSATGCCTPQTLTDAATVLVDVALGAFMRLAIGGNRLLGNPSNPGGDGQRITLRVTQTAGGHQLTFDTKYRFGTDLPTPILSAAAGAIDYLGFTYHLADDKWDYTAQVFGF